MRFFNTAGPVNCRDHYCLPPLERLDIKSILNLIEQKKYFVIHAPRHTGKTTYLKALAGYLNKQERYKALYFKVEKAHTARQDIDRGMRAILGEMVSRARGVLNDTFLNDIWLNILEKWGGDSALNEALTRWSEVSSKPLILLIDEMDSLSGDTLVSVLRQLRSGYDTRPKQFPQSIILCGVGDVQSYRIQSGREHKIITGGSAFNIKAESLRIKDFTQAEAARLWNCHTGETGQFFADGAVETAWELSEGQPWLVNALGYEVCFNMEKNRNRSVSITPDMVRKAGENLILRRDTHIEYLAEKLADTRIQKVIEPVLAGHDEPENISVEDIDYAADTGLIKKDCKIRIANQLYREIIPRELTYSTQLTIHQDPKWFITRDGLLNVKKMLSVFQTYYYRYAGNWLKGFQYKDAGPYLLAQAFMTRIVNSGGRIQREYGLGRQKTDLLIVWLNNGKIQEVVIELKELKGSLETTVKKGLNETWAYMKKYGASEGHLLIFDTSQKPCNEKIFCHQRHFKEGMIMVWGM
ncbi:AAA ATPase-like domain-containing protein [Desulfonema limicola]|uniref:AAA ATPase-like domain-containing protein n=1 Tax=Desulfonema limicola TaxID=45656 RepID=A0A975GHX6_9BACT|nr:ATP-binding protein [Desulfonema limicola]QTA82001.1 AAA ATPase-like domain-containing protein [Desulfonema limicola]